MSSKRGVRRLQLEPDGLLELAMDGDTRPFLNALTVSGKEDRRRLSHEGCVHLRPQVACLSREFNQSTEQVLQHQLVEILVVACRDEALCLRLIEGLGLLQ